MFHSLFFFQFSCKVEVLILLFIFFRVFSVVSWDNFCKFSLYIFLIIILSGLLAEIRWSVCMSKSHSSLCVLFSRANLNFLPISQWITLSTQSCLVLYSFWANFLNPLIMWLIVSSLSPHLPFCCVLSILALIWLVLTALFCAAIRRDSVFLLKFPFLSHVQVLSCEMLFISRLLVV